MGAKRDRSRNKERHAGDELLPRQGVGVVSKQGAGEAPKYNFELVLISREALEFSLSWDT